jgi:hypothetical protein
MLCAVAPQVLALTEITGVKGARARLLYKAGIRTPVAVAATGVDRCAWDSPPPPPEVNVGMAETLSAHVREQLVFVLSVYIYLEIWGHHPVAT